MFDTICSTVHIVTGLGGYVNIITQILITLKWVVQVSTDTLITFYG
jgi:hypothetical protein